MKKYLKLTGYILLLSFIYFAILLGLMYLSRFIASGNRELGRWINANFLFFVIVNDSLSLALFYKLIPMLHKQTMAERCKFTKLDPKIGGIIALTGLIAALFTGSVFKMPIIVEKVPILPSIMERMLTSGGLVFFLLFLVINSIYKEVLFRGLAFNELRKNTPFAVAFMLQGIFYGALFMNFNGPLSVYGFLGASLFVMLYVWFDSIWASVIAQIASTGGLYIINKTGDAIVNSGNLNYIAVVSLIGIIVAMTYLYKLRNKPKCGCKSCISA